MIVADLITLADTYTPGNKWTSLSGQSVSIIAINNPIFLQLAQRPPGGVRDLTWRDEERMSPGSQSWPGAAGIRARNAVATQTAQVYVRVYDKADFPGVGFAPTPFGLQVTETPANPAAGTAFTRTTGTIAERIATVSFLLTTSVAAGNRQVFLQILNAVGGQVDQVFADRVQAPSVALSYRYDRSIAAAAPTQLTPQMPSPSVILQPGWQMVISANGLAAADMITAIGLTLERSI